MTYQYIITEVYFGTDTKIRKEKCLVFNNVASKGKISDEPENAGNRILDAMVVDDFTYAYRTDHKEVDVKETSLWVEEVKEGDDSCVNV